MSKTNFITTLSEDIRNQIIVLLENKGFSSEEISVALDGRLSDLDDTIDISKLIYCIKNSRIF
jgi:hypothetical protein